MHVAFYWDDLCMLHFIWRAYACCIFWDDLCMLHFIGMTYAYHILLGWPIDITFY